jgi:hypothetical protein
MATTYVPVVPSQTLSSASATVTFSSIPATYTDLVLVMTPAANIDSQNVQIQFNGDTGSNYSYVGLKGNGTTAGVTRGTSLTAINLTDAIGTTTVLNGQIIICNIMNYANTTTFKTVINKSVSNSGTYNGVELMTGLWRSTAAINSIVIKQGSTPTFSAGSTFTLYGVASAAISGMAKATGGDTIATDGTYWYHAFRASGTFTPSVPLTCDYLVIAGGGAGGNGKSGGGGAGGLRSTVGATGGGGSLESPLSLTAQAYTVTIGAGGTASTSQLSGLATTRNGNNSVFATITATGGGGGGQDADNAGQAGGNGGSGGGAARNATVGTGTANQGFNGGTGFTGGGAYGGGGGGGAGAVGANGGVTIGGNGGAGVLISALATPTGTGVSSYYAGGGGACAYLPASGVPGTGGAGGGGNGASTTTSVGVAGTVNTGSGGGGNDGNGYSSGAGGSGLVIVRYAV